MSESGTTRRIGEIADATGLTVRTLRYYEDIDLLPPPQRTMSGHRLYGPQHVAILYQVSMLREVGMPLESVKTSLDAKGRDLRSLMSEHLASVDQQLSAQHRLRARLSRMIESLDTPEIGEALFMSSSLTLSGLRPSSRWRRTAAAPDTTAAAWLVPEPRK